MHILLNIFAYAVLLVGFGFIIFIHELGHFLAAKWVGIRVEQFALGFGHAIVAWRKGLGFHQGTTTPEFERRIRQHLGLPEITEKPLSGPQIDRGCAELGLSQTEYRWNWIPLGGYVKMVGQDDMDATATSDDPNSFSQKSVAARALVISAGVICNVILAGVLFLALFQYGFTVTPAKVGSVQSNSPAAIAGIEVGDTILEINGHEIHDWTDLTSWVALVMADKPMLVKIQNPDGTIRDLPVSPRTSDGPAGNLLALGVGQSFELRSLDPRDYTAADLRDAAGSQVDENRFLLPGEAVVNINDAPVTNWTDIQMLQKALEASGGKPVSLTVRNVSGVDRSLQTKPAFAPLFTGQTLQLAGLIPPTIVNGLTKNSPAEKRLKVGDIIVGMKTDGQLLEGLGIDSVRKATAAAGRDKRMVSFQVVRDNQTVWTEPVLPDFKLGDGNVGMGMGLGIADQMPWIAGVAPESAGARAGISAGGLIQRIDGKPVSNWFDILRILLASTGDLQVQVAVLDPQTRQPSQATMDYPLALSPADRVFLQNLRISLDFNPGFRPASITRKTANLGTALVWGVQETRKTLIQTYLVLHRMLSGSVPLSSVSGPIGIVYAGATVTLRGFDWYIWFLAIISANLAVVNFLPIPIMDGGVFVILLVEKIRGRPLEPRIQVALQYVGLAIILSIFLAASFNDIRRLL